MNGRHILLILAHLFRKKGKVVPLDDAIDYLSFRCRYGSPSNVRRMLSLALKNDMISKNGDSIVAEFLYDTQEISPNIIQILNDKVIIDSSVEEID
jgi:hypothetical protein